MGLDMYLSARKHINKIDWNKLDRDNGINYAAATFPEWNNVVEAAGVATLVDEDSIYGVDVSVNVAYWRKVNSVHGWFVENVQRGEDDCGEYYVSHAKLKELVNACTLAITNKDPSIMPPQEGFFFGGTDVDEWYWHGLMDTIKQIQPIIDRPDFESLSFYYQSSW
jgi:hypothetical protein